MGDFEDRIEQFKQLIQNSERIVFFGGAGVSTESGIPDFRSSDGLYNNRDVNFEKYSPEYLLSHSCLMNEPKVFFEFYRQKLDCREVQPNAAHVALAKMEAKGKLQAVITQNIDGLHQRAGSKRVLEVHGTTFRNYCMKCGSEYGPEYIFDTELDDQGIPRCSCAGCNGIVRPDVTLYEEGLPQAFNEAIMLASKADLMIIGGTSLTVYPAANILEYCNGKKVIINRDATRADRLCDLVFHENIGEVFSKVV